MSARTPREQAREMMRLLDSPYPLSRLEAAIAAALTRAEEQTLRADAAEVEIEGLTGAYTMAARENGELKAHAEALAGALAPHHSDSDGDWLEEHGPGKCDGCDALVAWRARGDA